MSTKLSTQIAHTRSRFEKRKHQLRFFAALIFLALISDQILTAIGSLSVFVSIFTSLIYIYCLVLIGSLGLRMIVRNEHNPLTPNHIHNLKHEVRELSTRILKPTLALAGGALITFLMIIIPGILFILRTMFVIPHTILEKTPLKEAFKRSITQTSKLTKGHVVFFILFAFNIFLFVSTSSLITDFSASTLFVLITFPVLTVMSFITARKYLELYHKTLPRDDRPQHN